MESVEQFIEQLLDSRGIDVEGEVRQQLKQDMMQRLLDQIDKAVINALPDDKVAELTEKLDDTSFTNEKMQQFVKESGVDAQQIALETMLQFKYLYLGNDAGKEAEPKTEAPKMTTSHSEGVSR